MGTFRIYWDQIKPATGQSHVARQIYRSGYQHQHHDHDFAELFWIESGKIRHEASEESVVLEVGDLVLLAPDCAHRLATVGKKPATLVNVAFPMQLLTLLAELDSELRNWFPPISQSFRIFKIQAEHLEALAQWAERLALESSNRLDLMAFLIEVIQQLRRQNRLDPELPGWLAMGLQQIEPSELMARGLSALVETTGRTRQHLARMIRQHLDLTPTELINHARMRYAASQLRLTDKSVLAICNECGLSNPTHFYRLFKTTYGMTPKQYRLHI